MHLEKSMGKMGGMMCTKCENHKNQRFSKCIIIFALSPNLETISACAALFPNGRQIRNENLFEENTFSVYREQQQK